MVVKKIVAPSNLCCEPYKTEWHADLETGMQIWIQINKDELNPKWIRLGELFESAVRASKPSMDLEDWIQSYNSFLAHN